MHHQSPKMEQPKPKDQENPPPQEEEEKELQQPPPQQLAIASISLTLSTLLPSPSFSKHKKKHLLPTPLPFRLRVPSSLSSSRSSSPTPLYAPFSLGPRRPADPSFGAPLRRAAICWFRNDLRLHDNGCLSAASAESLSVLPVYCFDPKDYGRSSSGSDKTGPFRAAFVIQSVADLRGSLQARGSDLVVRVGAPETVIPELARAVGADAVYVHREVGYEEVRAEERVEKAVKEDGLEVKYFWGSTLYHVDDLPFKVEEMPANYGGFREKVKGIQVRDTIPVPEELKGLPSGDVDAGEIPSLQDLGISQCQDAKGALNASMVGGETEALHRLQKFAAECQAQPPKGSNQESIYGANFSCKISPWLTMGCISPRYMFDELKKTTSRVISAASNQKGGGSGSSDTDMNWLMFELLWRDFFRFITKKYSSPKKQLDATPAIACTPAFA